MKISRKAMAVIGILLAALLALYFTGYLEDFARLFVDPSYLRDVVEPYGYFAALILIGLLLVQNIIWIIPGYGLGIAGGFIFGPYWGTLIIFVGTVISTAFAVIISDRYGRPIVKEIVGKKQLEKYDNLTQSTDVWPFVLMVIVPVIPDDLVAYLAGLSNLDSKKVIIAVSLARLPGVIALTVFGDGIATANYPLMILVSIAVIILVIISVYNKEKIIAFINSRG